MRGRKPKPTQTTVRKTLGYARVSTVEQSRNGSSLEAQADSIGHFAASKGWTVDEIIRDEGQSASNLARPGIQRVLQAVKAGEVERVVCAKLDRLTRSLKDLLGLVETFKKHDVGLVSVSETIDTAPAAGRMLMQLLGTFAEWESARIGERTAEVLANRRRKGFVYGKIPFGYRHRGARLVKEPREQRALTHIRRMATKGASLRQMAAWLTQHRFKPRHGGRAWYAQSVKQILGSQMARESHE